MDYLPPADEHNPYAAPESSIRGDRFPPRYSGNLRFTGPNPNATVRFEIIGEAWELLKERFGTWVLIMLVNGLVGFGIGMVLSLVAMPLKSALRIVDAPQRPEEMFPLLGFSFSQQFVAQLATAFLIIGLYRTALKQVRGESIEVADLFSGTNAWLAAALAMLLAGLATLCGLWLFLLPGLYIGARLSLTLPLIADAQLSATEAMGMSWKALGGKVLPAFAFYLVVSVVANAGLVACCVGVILTAPLWYLSFALLYRDFFLTPLDDSGVSPWIPPKQPDIAPEF